MFTREEQIKEEKGGAGRREERKQEKWRGEGGVRCDSTNYIVRTVILDSISSV